MARDRPGATVLRRRDLRGHGAHGAVALADADRLPVGGDGQGVHRRNLLLSSPDGGGRSTLLPGAAPATSCELIGNRTKAVRALATAIVHRGLARKGQRTTPVSLASGG